MNCQCVTGTSGPRPRQLAHVAAGLRPQLFTWTSPQWSLSVRGVQQLAFPRAIRVLCDCQLPVREGPPGSLHTKGGASLWLPGPVHRRAVCCFWADQRVLVGARDTPSHCPPGWEAEGEGVHCPSISVEGLARVSEGHPLGLTSWRPHPKGQALCTWASGGQLSRAQAWKPRATTSAGFSGHVGQTQQRGREVRVPTVGHFGAA